MVFVDDVSTPVVDDILASSKVKPFLAGVSGTFSSSRPRRLPLGVPVGASMKGTSHKGDLVDFITQHLSQNGYGGDGINIWQWGGGGRARVAIGGCGGVLGALEPGGGGTGLNAGPAKDLVLLAANRRAHAQTVPNLQHAVASLQPGG